jgi:hypothetical protein
LEMVWNLVQEEEKVKPIVTRGLLKEIAYKRAFQLQRTGKYR